MHRIFQPMTIEMFRKSRNLTWSKFSTAVIGTKLHGTISPITTNTRWIFQFIDIKSLPWTFGVRASFDLAPHCELARSSIPFKTKVSRNDSIVNSRV